MIADSERPPDQDGVTDSQLWRIDQICDGFETAWKSARRPQIEAFLERTAGARVASFSSASWCCLDVHYRRRQGESPQIAEYRASISRAGRNVAGCRADIGSPRRRGRRRRRGHRADGVAGESRTRAQPLLRTTKRRTSASSSFSSGSASAVSGRSGVRSTFG